MSKDRGSQTALARLWIGHTRLTHIYLTFGDYQPYWEDCVVPLTVRNSLVECLSLAELQQHFLFKCRGADEVYSFCRVLGPQCPSPSYDVLVFLKEARLHTIS